MAKKKPVFQKYFDRVEIGGITLADYLSGRGQAKDLFTLKRLVEYCQIWAGLLTPYDSGYPLIQTRELQPPFELALWEYKELPGFSMLTLDRDLDYQAEPFQFDLLRDPTCRAAGREELARNRDVFLSRLPRPFHATFHGQLGEADLTDLASYPAILGYLFQMDRAHLIARGEDGSFRLAGIFASFPSDLDREIKRFGFKIGKFQPQDNVLYERNRLFVYRYLMELYGFPIASERRTSAALFCRRLADYNENFFISVMGNSDRTLTFMSSRGRGRLPLVEKIALISIGLEDEDLIQELGDGGWLVDPGRRVVILKVTYAQHVYNDENVIEDRALSVVEQEIIHPRTGQRMRGLDLLKTSRSRLLRLNDIVRGEHQGHIVYQGQEIIHGTESHEDRLRFLYAWVSKHRRTILGYAPRTFAQVIRTLSSYLEDDALAEEFRRRPVEYRQVLALVRTMEQEFEVLRIKQALLPTGSKAKRLSYKKRLAILRDFLKREKELISYGEDVFEKAMLVCDRVLGSAYFNRRYLHANRLENSEYENQVLELYREVMLQKSEIEWAYHRANFASSAV